MAILLHEEGIYEKAKIFATDINAKMSVQKIPKRHRDEKVDGPFVGGHPDVLLARACQANVFPRFKPDQHQRNHFQRAEHRSEAEHNIRRSREIEVMKGSDNAAGEKHHGGKHDGLA